jgi:hypothetical protein
MTDSSLLAGATALLERNTRQATYKGKTYRFSVPSLESYPFQWLWDSCFHAMVWAKTDKERAKDELRGLFAFQRSDGMIPHVVFWNRNSVSRKKLWHYLESDVPLRSLLTGLPRPVTTAQSQPPVIAQAVEEITGETDLDFIKEVLPFLERFYRFWDRERDPNKNGLISTISQFETGLDYSPAYDKHIGANPTNPLSIFLASRRVQWRSLRAHYRTSSLMRSNDQVEDVLVNSIYIDGLRSLSRLALAVGNTDLASWAHRTSTKSATSLLEKSWDREAGVFWNLAGLKSERQNRVRTIQGLMPLLLDDLPLSVSERLLETLTNEKLFWSKYPIPSVALNEETYLSDSHSHGIRLIWRGPASMNTNYLIWKGLMRNDQTGLASHIAARSRDMVLRGGFNEFYDAQKGVPVGAKNFGWATLVCLMS